MQERAWEAPPASAVSKLEPQAQEWEAFGFEMENPCFMTSSM